jgi:peptide/nickel transport system permease protein
MLRYALRRVLWAIPTLLATSLVLFFVTTLAPDPAPGTDDPVVEEARRERFVDLPRFVNVHPQDVVSRSSAAVAHVGAGDAQSRHAARELRGRPSRRSRPRREVASRSRWRPRPSGWASVCRTTV